MAGKEESTRWLAQRLLHVTVVTTKVQLHRQSPLAAVTHIHYLATRILERYNLGAACKAQELVVLPFDPYVGLGVILHCEILGVEGHLPIVEGRATRTKDGLPEKFPVIPFCSTAEAMLWLPFMLHWSDLDAAIC